MSATVIPFKPKPRLGPIETLLVGRSPFERHAAMCVVRAYLAGLADGRATRRKRKPNRPPIDEAAKPR
jgi:hypothetical protein